MKGNMLIAHGGGPTAVINASLYGAIDEAKKDDRIEEIYGALGGTEGILKEDFVDFNKVSQEELELLLTTPASAIGTSRFPLYDEEYGKMIEVFEKYNIKYILFNGGNGSMDTCGQIHKRVKDLGIKVVGIPKTIDNDISITDHCPGFGSAANFIATSVAEVAQDVKSLPIHVSIIESMGRNAGWIAASSALARKDEGDAPHLIYLPEKAFDEEAFLADVKRLHEEKGGVVVVVSEGLLAKDGKPVAPPIFETERATYFGDTGTYLATLVIEKLGIKARSEKPGLLGRTSIGLQSKIDREEAIEAGRAAAKAALAGETGVMVGLKRISNDPYKCETILIPIDDVMMHERTMPESYINDRGNDVTEEFIEWCKPLIGTEIPSYINFRK